MNNPLYVTLRDAQGNLKTVVYYVAIGCTLKEATEDIQQEIEPYTTIVKVSYSRD